MYLLLEVSRTIKTHVKHINSHTFTHQIIFKDISTHLSSQFDTLIQGFGTFYVKMLFKIPALYL